MAKDQNGVKEELYELFNDAVQNAKSAKTPKDKEIYLQQALKAAEILLLTKEPESEPWTPPEPPSAGVGIVVVGMHKR